MMMEVTGKLKGRIMRTNTKRHDVTTRAIGPISITTTSADEFTIVEIVVGGKHYHGLTKRNASADSWSEDAGIVIAARRAFDLMMDDQFSPKLRAIDLGNPLGGKSPMHDMDLYRRLMKNNPCREIIWKNEHSPVSIGVALHKAVAKSPHDMIAAHRNSVMCKLLL